MIKTDKLVVDKDEIVSVQLHEKDLHALVQLLNVSYDTYTKIAVNAEKLEEPKDVANMYAARAALAAAFATKLNSFIDFAEPMSKEFH